jgi:hypothetical protein
VVPQGAEFDTDCSRGGVYSFQEPTGERSEITQNLSECYDRPRPARNPSAPEMESRGPPRPSGDLVGGCCAGCARAAPALARPARCAAAAPIADSFAEVHELASAEANGRPSVLPLAVLPTGLPCSACGTTDTARKEPLGTVGRISFDSDPQASAVVVTKNRRDVASWATRGQGTDTQRIRQTEGSSAQRTLSTPSLTGSALPVLSALVSCR